MVSNEEKLKWLKENCTDSDGRISLYGLEAPELIFDFSFQKAKKIYNSYQEAETISNSNQKAKLINNSRQIIVDKKTERIKELESELYNLKNS